jgi:hypothetical protein
MNQNLENSLNNFIQYFMEHLCVAILRHYLLLYRLFETYLGLLKYLISNFWDHHLSNTNYQIFLNLIIILN